MAERAAETPLRIFFATPSFEEALVSELSAAWRTSFPGSLPDWPGLIVIDEPEPRSDTATADAARTAPLPADPVFARQQMPHARPIHAASVAALAEACYAAVERAIDQSGGPFTIHTTVPTGADPRLASRAALIADETLSLLRQRRKRAARSFLSATDAARAFGQVRVLVQILLVERDRGFVSAAAPRALAHGGWDLAPWPAGVAPVAEDRRPPSRAYRKLEEAFAWMDDQPRPGQLCVDLGAAPGGWTYGALARGARVIAIDRAPLDPSLRAHPALQTVAGNAFTYAPPTRADWLLSDIVCEPSRALALLDTWITGALCRNLIVTIKFKGRDGYGILATVRHLLDQSGWPRTRIKHLQHNKNEVTVMAKSHP